MAVTMKRGAENSAKIGGPGVRPREVTKHFVVPPNETTDKGEWHLSHNAADLVLIRGWTYASDPRKPMAFGKPAGTTAPVDDEDADDAVVVETTPATKKQPDPVVDEFQALRAEAEALGVKVDARWGRARLTQEIAEATAAKTAG